ncbi:ABC transporter substrate-binding protein [Paracoccus sp. PS-1]|uniref:ABC transporter substrate-binding protein n=1 Tax=unclassified Paracoccus (in: a-proteobacteria) TaxID=2688777 RepID=UPI00048D4940|nr:MULTISPECIES: ABC transporter substrate-binding protein [unclassified Paracoccus (in: a-proteobacteria)]MDQ7263942.1 ABC transporter substrate-binding protein [Paracoccus sp. PS1]UFM63282.1 ABC transporter substrate-binding protein [Paracoccus sp. MA]
MVTAACGFSRRAFLAAACGLAGGALPAFAAGGLRLAAVDWAMAETAMALGHPPAALAELIGFRDAAAAQPPQSTVDLGLRGAPNLEALSLVAPDLILSSSYYSAIQPRLERIAPVFTRALYVAGEPAFPKVMAVLGELAERLGDPAAGPRAQAAAQAEFAMLAGRAAPFADRACLMFQLGDSRHIRVFGTDSLFSGALEAIGLRNAWAARTSFAFAAPVPLEKLAEYPEARLVIVGRIPPQAERGLGSAALWNSLPPVKAGRVHRLPELRPFAGIPSALRFAHELVAALEARA